MSDKDNLRKTGFILSQSSRVEPIITAGRRMGWSHFPHSQGGKSAECLCLVSFFPCMQTRTQPSE